MEDFGFKLQNIKNYKGNNFKIIIKFILIFLSILIFIILASKIVKILSNNDSNTIESVILIKSEVKDIKRKPDKESGLDVDNLGVSVYSVIDNKDNNNEPIIKKINQTLDVDKMVEDSNDNILNSEQSLLNQKINEISTDSEIKLANENKISNDNNNSPKINISINPQEKTVTNVEDLNKLGNKSLIDNLKAKKDIKPGIKVQLLALKSKDGLIKYWNEVSEKYSEIFNDKSYYIEEVNTNQLDYIYRLHVGNFDTEDSASAFCKSYVTLANKSKIDCIIVKNK